MLWDETQPHRRTAHAYALARMATSELTELREEVKRLGMQLEQARERERRRIAREMHDSTVQDLVAIGLMLRRLDDMVGKPVAKKVLGEARDVLARTQQDLRTLSYLLHPPMLDDQGLVVALRSLIRGLSSRMRTRIDLICEPPGLRTSIELENELYRVVQEALINVHKHAQAGCALVRYFRDGGRLVLEVEDDGVGVMAGDGATLNAGVGIQGMRARVEPFGGTLTLSPSSEGQGMLVRAEIPIIETARSFQADEEFLLPITPWKEGLP
ncbi:MAG TPA: histidine kinase [Croceibacterium sp.]